MADAADASSNDDCDAESDSADSENTYINVWQRWRGGTDVPFHQYCDFYPSSETDDQIVDTEESDVWLFYTQGATRQILRYTPVVIFFVIVVLMTLKVPAGRYGFLQYVEGTQFEGFLTEAAVSIVWLVILLYLLKSANLLPASDLLQAIVVYSVIAFLLFDMGYWVVETTIAVQTDTLDAIEGVTPSGFLLMLFIGGHLVYDGMLRTEHMFSNLTNKTPPIIGPTNPPDDEAGSEEREKAFKRAHKAYENNYLDEFKHALEQKIPTSTTEQKIPISTTRSVRTAVLFSVVFVFPFFVTGVVLAVGSAHPGAIVRGLPSVIGIGLLSLLAVVKVVVFFQFLILIKYFYRLLTKHSPYQDENNDGFTLQYQPHHPDGYAGFRDMGKFATRVNTLLLAGGVYTAYRIYTSGMANLPVESSNILAPDMLLWAFQFLGPLLVYALTVIVWVYFSFWQIHKAMRRGRERRINRELPDEQDGELPEDKRDFNQAPVWPLSINKFIGLLVGDMVPLLSLLPLLQP